MNTILGLAMFYAWIHSVIVIFRKLKEPTTYEKVVLWAGFAAFILFTIGTITEGL